MGLAATKNRRKIGQDPNNTTWSRDTETYGAKIMAAQGWTPGSYLGAKDAAHAAHYTAANASHIRVALKDDNLGLGAGKGKADGENFGLGLFQDILGRLNGKSSEQIVTEQIVRADLGRRSYIEKKWGPSRFVSGGYLVGDKVEEEKTKAFELSPVESDRPSSRVASDKTSRKRRREVEVVNASQKGAEESDSEDITDLKETDKKSSKKKREGKTKEERRQRKAERRARKDARRLEEVNGKAQGESSQGEESTDVSNKSIKPEAASGTQSPAIFGGSRQAVRQRYIRQKKMASMDANALREILMLKS